MDERRVKLDYFEDGRIARIMLDNPPVNLTNLEILDQLILRPELFS